MIYFDEKWENYGFHQFAYRGAFGSLWVGDGCAANGNQRSDSFVQGFRPNDVARRTVLSDICATGGAHACESSKVDWSGPAWTAGFLGRVDFYGFRFRWPGPYAAPSSFCVYPQLAYPTVRYSNIALNFRPTGGGLEEITLDINAGYSKTSAQFDYRDLGWQLGRFPISFINVGQWHEVMIEVKYATGFNEGGYIVCWHRMANRQTPPSWTMKFDSRINNYAAYVGTTNKYHAGGVPTMQHGWTIGDASFFAPDGEITVGGSGYAGIIAHWGLYRGGAIKAAGTSLQADSIIEEDRLIHASTFAECENRLNADGQREKLSIFPTTPKFTGVLGTTNYAQPEMRLKVTTLPAVNEFIEIQLQKSGTNFYAARIHNVAGVYKALMYKVTSGSYSSVGTQEVLQGFVAGDWLGASYRDGILIMYRRAAASGSPWNWCGSFKDSSYAATLGPINIIKSASAQYDANSLSGGAAAQEALIAPQGALV